MKEYRIKAKAPNTQESHDFAIMAENCYQAEQTARQVLDDAGYNSLEWCISIFSCPMPKEWTVLYQDLDFRNRSLVAYYRTEAEVRDRMAQRPDIRKVLGVYPRG